MLSGFALLLALGAVVAVLVWSIKFDRAEGVPRSGLFGIRASVDETQRVTHHPQLPTKKRNIVAKH
jgi:hypothetical protein